MPARRAEAGPAGRRVDAAAAPAARPAPRARQPVDVLQAMADPHLFSRWFADDASWRAWRAFLAVLFGLPLDRGAAAVARKHTGRSKLPRGGVTEAWLVVGRRGGKSIILALIAVYLAVFKDWRSHLTPGERGTVMLLAADRRQARVLLRYIKSLVLDTELLRPLVERETQDGIDLSNRISIEVHTSNFRNVRGYTIIAALCDELAFWFDENSANPDEEVIAAVRPGMATVPGAVLIGASSPYARRGVLWREFDRGYGRDDARALVWQGHTTSMNPSVPEAVIREAYDRDPASAAAEYGAEFRSDVSGFLDAELIAAVTRDGARELPPREGVGYKAFADPSGGRDDAFTLAIGHLEGGRQVVDLCRAWPAPFSPEAVVDEAVGVLRRYRVHEVRGDAYAAAWVREAFQSRGVRYLTADRPKGELYLEALPAFTEGSAELPDDPALTRELLSLERRTGRTGRDRVDHPPRGHDDRANAACGLLALLCRRGTRGVFLVSAGTSSDDPISDSPRPPADRERELAAAREAGWTGAGDFLSGGPLPR